MDMYEYIRFSHFNLGQSIRKVHRTTGLDRKTIRKAISGYDPKYRTEKPREKVVIGPYVELIRQWLHQDKRTPKKQRHTIARIHSRLRDEHGYPGSLTTTNVTVSELRNEMDVSKKEVFIPSDPEKREGAEMDWGELYVDLNGKRTRVCLFTMRSKYSGKVFARLYPVMIQACFFDGHIRAFAYFDGVFDKIIYDNLKSAVKTVLKGKERVEQSLQGNKWQLRTRCPLFAKFHQFYIFFSHDLATLNLREPQTHQLTSFFLPCKTGYLAKSHESDKPYSQGEPCHCKLLREEPTSAN